MLGRASRRSWHWYEDVALWEASLFLFAHLCFFLTLALALTLKAALFCLCFDFGGFSIIALKARVLDT
jgi:hypothetical protein